MKFICALFTTVVVISSTYASTKVIYGSDNRKEYYQVGSHLQKLADSTAGMISDHQLRESFKGYTYQFLNSLNHSVRYNTGFGLCRDEQFREQTIAPSCSAFLVAPNILVTAGHCVDAKNPLAECKRNKWVFGYQYTAKGALKLRDIKEDNVYNCKSIISYEFSNQRDYAVIELDRDVVGREPLKLAKHNVLPNNSKLVVIGHPNGLPTKIADGGRIIDNTRENEFVTTLDTFQGNSGSAVFNAVTGEVEGILVSGKTDYAVVADDKGNLCSVANVCDDQAQNCIEEDPRAKGEAVTRTAVFAKYIQ